MIYLITYARGKYPNREEQSVPMVYWGYYTSREEAQERVDALTRQAYVTWRAEERQQHARSVEDFLYPELVVDREKQEFLQELFGVAAQRELDLSERAYRESGRAAVYGLLPIASATDGKFGIPDI